MEELHLKRNTNLASLTLIPIIQFCVITLLFLFLPVIPNLAGLFNTAHKAILEMTTGFGVFYTFSFLIWSGLSVLYGHLPFASIFLLLHFLYLIFIAQAIPSMIAYAVTLSIQKIRDKAVSIYTCLLFNGASLGSLLPNYIGSFFIYFYYRNYVIHCWTEDISI